MAWRIDEAVVRGEIDNRTRGHVTGRLWFAGRAEPVVLDLAGNCWRDLAGRRLEFTNPQPQPGDLEELASLQRGVVGDISASRKVKVPDIPPGDLHLYYKTGREMPWHWANALYLEWISERNGRIVLESATFELKIVGEPAWEMSEAEEEAQRKANGAALTGLLGSLAAAADPADPEKGDDTPAEWDEPPQTEEEAEAEQARSDKLSDRIEARLAREGKEADYEKILEEELERLQREEGRPPLTPEQEAARAAWIDDMNEEAEALLANPDPAAAAERDLKHPLVERVSTLADQLHHTAEEMGWLPPHASAEHPVAELLSATMLAGPKLAGALNGYAWPPELGFCAHTIVRLKRARVYLEDALRALESCHEEKLIAPEHLGPTLAELIDCTQDTDELIAELRARLERGTD